MKQFVFGLSCATLVGASLLLATANTDYDHSADFTKYHSYSWLKVQASNQLWESRITQAVDSQLVSKGWQKVPSGGDASIAGYGAQKDEKTLQTFYDGFGGGWGWRGWGGGGMGMSTTNVEHNTVGSLVLDIFDTQSKKLIWRGTSSANLSDKPEKNEKKLEKDVEDMFKKFPPPSKG